MTIPKGYHNGSGSVGVAGGNRGNWGTTINPGGSVTIPQGYHSGGGVVRANNATPTAARAGACWANGYANGSGFKTSSYVSGGKDTYSAWNTAAVSGYFAIWRAPNSDANAASFTYGYYNAGAQLLKFGPDDGYGSGYITYVGTQ